MSLRNLSVKALLFFRICQVGLWGLVSASELKEQPEKIAVIGGGIGGTGAAYFLRQEFGPPVKIDVFEAGPVGGRLATENIRGHEYETGGSIIHPLNLHMKHFVDKLGTESSFYEVNYVGDSGPAHSIYDIVIVATPRHEGLSDFSPPIPSPFPGHYHHLVTTLVLGQVNTSYLGIDQFFSQEPLSEEQLREIFVSWEGVWEKRWLAYPSYSSSPHPPFVLHDRLYYLSAIEWAASCMELSVVAARNMALLAYHHWHDQTDKIDQEDLHPRLRGEL
ncbi:prenylcysteine oxidase-like [Pygocentrus nattereri]|uniref:prenylcysteine oxidase-like n=1 Tax=Pygocentrus nattereri TaxID=42514 RepID=UPI0008143512|nr:prenylcysteine oxidase-like [Pygocentrus nattereri]